MNDSLNNDGLKSFGIKLAAIRKSKKMSLEMLSNLAEIDLSGLHRIETGKTNPKLMTIISLAKALNVSPKDFFDN